jgi:hypothetical protein
MRTYSELLNSCWRMYEQVRAYDLHYSTIRTTVSTILLTASLTAGGLLLANKHYYVAVFLPTSLLFISILLSNYFVYLMKYCSSKAGKLEELIRELSINEKLELTEGAKKILAEGGLFEFRAKFDQKIKAYSVCYKFPSYLFKEPGTRSLTIITIVYFIFTMALLITA